MKARTVHVVSVSGGKDSTATLLVALERCPREDIVAVFCDTGNEHQDTYDYLNYLERATGVEIKRLKADFTDEIRAKRSFIARDSRTKREYKRVLKTDANGNPVYLKDKAGNIRMFERIDEETGAITYAPQQVVGWNGGRLKRWSNKAKRRALEVMVPSGNPFLDLCMWKGLFPSRKAQFCTEELKRNQAVAFQLELMDAGHNVISWQGVRRDESFARRNAKKTERVGTRLRIFRPVVDWTAAQVFDYAASKGIAPNPLYLQGMGRVGCMPCINCSKPELRAIGRRFPEHPERIGKWEEIVSRCSKRGASTFMTDAHDAVDRRIVFRDLNIHARVDWSNTTHGGKQRDLLADLDEPGSCSSSYGLCE